MSIDRPRLAKILGMLGSAHDGERASAAAKADQLVRGSGSTWHEVVNPPAKARTGTRGSANAGPGAVITAVLVHHRDAVLAATGSALPERA
jgi:hypothetical protein